MHMVAWLGLACEATSLDDALLHGAVLTLDRCAASSPGFVSEQQLLKFTLAALCTEMKLSTMDDFQHWQQVLMHLAQGRMTVPGVLEAEALMLRQLQFVVGVPTPLTFLHGLGMRHMCSMRGGMARSPAAALRLELARLLLDLALLDPSTEYRFSPLILAGCALGVALMTVGNDIIPTFEEDQDANDVQPDLKAEHETLLDDMASYSVGIVHAEVMVRDCEQTLLEIWQEALQPSSRLYEFFEAQRERHANSRRLCPSQGGADWLGSAFLGLSPQAGLARMRTLY